MFFDKVKESVDTIQSKINRETENRYYSRFWFRKSSRYYGR